MEKSFIKFFTSLPIGIQSFEKLRKQKRKYVDKTPLISQMIQEGGWYRLNRPRRFGKSLLLSTIKGFYQGNQGIFQGLAIEKQVRKESFPILHFDFSTLADSRSYSIEESLEEMLTRMARHFDLTLQSPCYNTKFVELIEKLAKKEKKRIVILGDEFDRPLTDEIKNPEKFFETFQTLRKFFAGFKAVDQHLEFVLFVGIMNPSNLFRSLNNLQDLTLVKDYAGITGFTEAELDRYFQEELKELAKAEGVSYGEIREKMNSWFSGYSWDGETFCSNPWDILNSLGNKKLSDYWCQTGESEIFRKLLRQHPDKVELSGIQVSESRLHSCDIKKIDPVPALFQNGYLTVRKVDQIVLPYQYTLDFPNSQVRQDFLSN